MHPKCCLPFEMTRTHGKANQLPLKELSTAGRVIGPMNYRYNQGSVFA